MNHAFIRPGGLAQDLPPGAVDPLREFVKTMRKNLPEYDKLAHRQPRSSRPGMQDIGYLDLAGCMALGATGPILRSAGLPHDLRKARARTAATRPTSSRSPPPTPATPTAAS